MPAQGALGHDERETLRWVIQHGLPSGPCGDGLLELLLWRGVRVGDAEDEPLIGRRLQEAGRPARRGLPAHEGQRLERIKTHHLTDEDIAQVVERAIADRADDWLAAGALSAQPPPQEA